MRHFKNKKKLLGIIVLCVMGCVAITPTPEDTTNDTKTVESKKNRTRQWDIFWKNCNFKTRCS